MKTAGIYLAIVVFVALTTWSQANNAECKIGACHSPSKTGMVSESNFCSLAEKYIQCLTDNVITKHCGLKKQNKAKSLRAATKVNMKKKHCKHSLSEITANGGTCDLDSCKYPLINSTSFCEEASEYVNCIQAILFDVDNCHWEQTKDGYLMSYLLAHEVVFNQKCLGVPDQKKNGNMPFCITKCRNE
ncbi:uncharacterized protein LOC131949919 [Physella acuta]|uniref:uncharacterized protein LOC131949919 n=1 Tax=Physella acuta TaxID=109671 RepID=UPI0027DDF108|nr:uncharacterized protein LOC131949919 [Physella acuta]